jgi:mono/diheme cytochrome c family protein
MSGTTRAGMLLLLAACGGGGAAKSDTTAMSSASAGGQSSSAVPDTSMTPATSQDTARPSAGAAESAATKPQDTVKKSAKAPAKAATKTQDTAKAAAAKPKAAAGGTQPPLTPQMIAQGDSIFHGLVGGGTCSACHGQDAKGTAVAPDLTDQQWLNGDGSYDFMVRTITDGVPKPKQHPAPMPPKGGAPLTDDQVKAVAAYEYSLSHKT